jgi:hypothetical protein
VRDTDEEVVSDATLAVSSAENEWLPLSVRPEWDASNVPDSVTSTEPDGVAPLPWPSDSDTETWLKVWLSEKVVFGTCTVRDRVSSLRVTESLMVPSSDLALSLSDTEGAVNDSDCVGSDEKDNDGSEADIVIVLDVDAEFGIVTELEELSVRAVNVMLAVGWRDRDGESVSVVVVNDGETPVAMPRTATVSSSSSITAGMMAIAELMAVRDSLGCFGCFLFGVGLNP